MIGHGHFSTVFQIKLLFRNVGENFVLLMPIGILLPILIKKINSIKKTFVLGLAVSLSTELMQFFEGFLKITIGRTMYVDDLILNFLGAAVGYIIYVFGISVIAKYKKKLV